MPVWGPERPLTLLWIAVDDGVGGRALLGANEIGRARALPTPADDGAAHDGPRREIAAAADERGLPIAWPLLDLEDLNAVSFIDVWGRFEDRILAASVRYRADAVLIGRVRPGCFGNEVEWLFVNGVERQALAGVGRARRARRGRRSSTRRSSARSAARTSTLLTVRDVATSADYGRVMSYLERQSVLESVDVESFERRRAEPARRGARRCARARARARARRRVAARADRRRRGRRVDVRGRGRRCAAMSWRFLPNAICVARMLLVAPLVLLLVEGRYDGGAARARVAGLSDGLDGFLAKRFDWQTRLGGLLDPAADKLLLVSVFAALSYVGARAARVDRRSSSAATSSSCSGAICYQLFIAPVQGRARRDQQAEHGVPARDACSSR